MQIEDEEEVGKGRADSHDPISSLAAIHIVLDK
jgi:hypothetical protein